MFLDDNQAIERQLSNSLVFVSPAICPVGFDSAGEKNSQPGASESEIDAMLEERSTCRSRLGSRGV
jgi:hypothetical protein